MKSFLRFSGVFILLLATACASIHPGMMGSSMDGTVSPLQVSGQIVTDYSNANNFFIDFTFENTGNDWLRIKSIDYFGQPDIPYNIVVGDDLATWQKAMQDKAKISSYNDKWLAAGLATAGALSLAASGGKMDSGTRTALQAVGGAALVGGAAVAVKSSQKKSFTAVTSSEMVPDTHIYKPFAVPAKAFQRRWVLIHVPSGKLGNVAILKITTVEGQVQKFRIPLE